MLDTLPRSEVLMILALLAACSVTVPLPLSGDPLADGPSQARPVGQAAPTGYPDWTVDCKGGGDFTTLGDAVDIAADGDWIAVAPCTYHETLDYQGKSLWIASTGSSADTILNAGRDRAVTATDGTGDGTALVGFTIEDGRDSNVSVIYVEQSALRLEDVKIASSSGGYAILYAASSDVELQNVQIDDSNTLGYYGAILISRGALSADTLTVDCKTRSYAAYITHGSFFLDHSSLSCRTGTSLAVTHSTGRVHRSTLGDAISIEAEDDHYTDTVIFENDHLQGDLAATNGSILLRNSLVDGGTLSFDQVYGVYIQASVLAHSRCPLTYAWTAVLADSADTAVEATPEPIVDISYSDFFDDDFENCDRTTTYSGVDGNLSSDPRFADESGGDYSTDAGSPLIDAGLPDAAYNDPDGTTNDIGLYGGPRSVGGGW